MSVRTLQLAFLCLGFAFSLQHAPETTTPASVTVAVDAASGSYNVSYGSSLFLMSSPISLCVLGQMYSMADGSLQVLNATPGAGTDQFGQWSSTDLSISAKADSSITFTTIFKSYASMPNAVVFTAAFPVALSTSGCGDTNEISTQFPAFLTDVAAAADAVAISWADQASQTTKITTGMLALNNSGLDCGPVVLSEGSSGATLVVSTLDNHKIIGQRTQFASPRSYSVGLTAAIAAGIPAGFSYSAIVFGGAGITSTVYAWGAALQRYYNTSRTPSITLTSIGVYTDDGAYYYVWEAFNITARPWPAEVGLQLVVDRLHEQGLSPQYLQMDDWWYDGPFYFGNVKCVQEWVGDVSPRLFPHGLPAFQRGLQLGLILYTPFWCDTYQTNYTMTESTAFPGTKLVVPTDSYPFFRDLFVTGQALANGQMVGYEIDFLGPNYVGSASMFETVTSAHQWYAGMASAAAEQNITIQYCLSYPNDILVSLEFPSVTNARAGPDYVSKITNAQAIGGSSLLFGSLAIAPSKDTFWTTSPQPPTMSDFETNYTTQPHVQLDAVLATFSLGPVGFSDALNYTDAGLLNQTCMSNGTVLRPSRPLSWVDSHFFTVNTNYSDVRATHASLAGLELAGWYIVAWSNNHSVQLVDGDLYPPLPSPVVPIAIRYHNWSTGAGQGACIDGASAERGCIQVLPAGTQPLVPSTTTAPGNFVLMQAVPRLSNGWYLLGELAKFAPLAPQRFASVTIHEGGGVSAVLQGAEGECVSVTAVTAAGIVQVRSVTFTNTLTAEVEFV